MLRATAELYTYTDISDRFPFQNEDSGKSWAMLLLRLRNEKKLKEGVHFKRIYVDRHFRRVYDLQSVVRAIAIESRGNKPRALTSFLTETYYDAFCAILSPVAPITPGTPETEEIPS